MNSACITQTSVPAFILMAISLPLFASANTLMVGPDYAPPSNTVPAHYKSTGEVGWKEGKPLDNLPKGSWWNVFGDSTLNELERQSMASNQDIKAAYFRVQQARATARIDGSFLLPTVTADPSLVRQHYSPNMLPSFGNLTANQFSTPLDLSYEIDLWGRVRRGFESARAEFQASEADYQNVLLSLQAEIAGNYFTLRALDLEIETVTDTVGLRKNNLKLVEVRHQQGVGNKLEVAQAKTELANTEANLAALEQRRDQLENTLAILAGQNPSTFRVLSATPTGRISEVPEIPVGLPSDLLERRPDIAAAERQLASSSAKIGVAKAAFFPVVSLTGSAGFLSADAETLFDWGSHAWAVGPSVSLPIFSAGRNRANLARAKYAFEEAMARYREQVLVAFADVEDSLCAINHLQDQAGAEQRALENAREYADLARERYKSGAADYLEVIDADRQMLAAKRAQIQTKGQQLAATVHLIKALGGGWTPIPSAPIANGAVSDRHLNPIHTQL